VRLDGEEFAPDLAPELGADTDEVLRNIAQRGARREHR
jgi:hypothetical protein